MERQEAIRQLLTELICRHPGFQDKLAAVLSARGFLIEDDPMGMWLSDNSHKDDNAQLSTLTWAVKGALGAEERMRQSMDAGSRPGGRPSGMDDLVAMFSKPVRRETQICRGRESWAYFRNRHHGCKVPVVMLEPLVARLVKAVSAAGLTTVMSCDGHGENLAWIEVAGAYNAAWCRALVQAAGKRISCECSWSCHRDLMTVSHPAGDLLRLYTEMLAMADAIYDLRREFRNARRAGIDRIEAGARAREVQPTDIPLAEMAEIYALETQGVVGNA